MGNIDIACSLLAEKKTDLEGKSGWGSATEYGEMGRLAHF